jgi:death-on-curing protein
MLKILNESVIIKINKKIANYSYLIKPLTCYSSINYYNNNSDKISSIIRSILKDHNFIDGNKRTAVALLYILIKSNNIIINKTHSEIINIVVDISANNFSPNEISMFLLK